MGFDGREESFFEKKRRTNRTYVSGKESELNRTAFYLLDTEILKQIRFDVKENLKAFCAQPDDEAWITFLFLQFARLIIKKTDQCIERGVLKKRTEEDKKTKGKEKHPYFRKNFI